MKLVVATAVLMCFCVTVNSLSIAQLFKSRHPQTDQTGSTGNKGLTAAGSSANQGPKIIIIKANEPAPTPQAAFKPSLPQGQTAAQSNNLYTSLLLHDALDLPFLGYNFGGNNAAFGGNNAAFGGNNAAFGGNNAVFGGNNAAFGGNNAALGANNDLMNLLLSKKLEMPYPFLFGSGTTNNIANTNIATNTGAANAAHAATRTSAGPDPLMFMQLDALDLIHPGHLSGLFGGRSQGAPL